MNPNHAQESCTLVSIVALNCFLFPNFQAHYLDQFFCIVNISNIFRYYSGQPTDLHSRVLQFEDQDISRPDIVEGIHFVVDLLL